MTKKRRRALALATAVLAIVWVTGPAASAIADSHPRPRPWRRPLHNLEQRVSRLEGRMAAMEAGGAPVEIEVDCAAGQSLSDALGRGAQTWGPLIITISGTCRENVDIRRDDTILRGANPGDGLIGEAAWPLDLIVVAADRVSLDQLTLRTTGVALLAEPGASLEAGNLDIDGSDFGVVLLPGSSAVMWEINIRNSQSTQLSVQGATLELWGCLIEDGQASGLSVTGGSALIDDCTIQRNASSGVYAGDNAEFSVYGSDILENTTGVRMTTGASGSLGVDTRIAQNTSFGVQERSGSVLTLGAGVSIDHHGAGGVSVTGGSFVQPIWATITDNEGPGIHLGDTSLAGSWDLPGQPVIQNNKGWGVSCASSPAVAQVAPIGYPMATVTGNTLGASNCPSLGDPTRIP
jgi:hypothetical protein